MRKPYVSWFGARAYCEWAGKELPRVEEWQKAAESKGGTTYLWGNEFDPAICADDYNRTGGRCPIDYSRIGCFDMAGNVAEWCDDPYDKNNASLRAVCGRGFKDKDPSLFEKIDQYRHPVDQVDHQPWVGFRGVVRVPVDGINP